MQELIGIVDIGTQQVRLLIGQPEGTGRVSVLGVGIAPAEGIDENGVANIERLVYAIQQALRQAIQQSGAALNRVWVVTNHIQLQGEETQAIVTFPNPEHEIALNDLERLRQQAVQRPAPPGLELVHIIPQFYNLDHRSYLRDPLGMTGIRLEGHFYLVYLPQHHLTMLRRCFQRLGLEIEGFAVRPLLAAEAFLSADHKAANAAFLYLGNHTTSLVLYEDKRLRHFVVLPLGGYHVTMDIREMLRYILFPQAEELKTKQGAAFAAQVPETEILRLRLQTHTEPIQVSRRMLAEVIQARLEEIFLFAAKEIDKVGLLGRLYGGIHYAGGGSLMEGMQSLIEYLFGEHAYKVQVSQLLGRGVIQRVDTPRMAGAVAALYLAPVLREFLPPPSISPTNAAQKEKRFIGSSQLLQKVKNLLQNSIKLPQDLID